MDIDKSSVSVHPTLLFILVLRRRDIIILLDRKSRTFRSVSKVIQIKGAECNYVTLIYMTFIRVPKICRKFHFMKEQKTVNYLYLYICCFLFNIFP
jgi:hypothetical protein